MSFVSVFRSLGRNDVKLIGRDSFLVGLLFYVIIISLAMRFMIPWATDQMLINANFDLEPLYPMLTSFFACITMGGVLAGMLTGFIVLDEKDDNTIMAMMVTPVPIMWYLVYRIVVPMLVSFLAIIISVHIMNLTVLPWEQLIAIAAGGAFIAPTVMLVVANFANNKVEGFAQLKALGSSGLIVMGAFFLETPVQYLAGFYPPYWIAKSFWQAAEGASDWWVFLIIGVVYLTVCMVGLLRLFQRNMHR